jgi:hypothetical protein
MIVKINEILTRVFNFMPGPFFGIVSTIIGLLGDILAIIFFPSYTLSQMISILGTGAWGVFFNFGTIFSGIFALPFYFYLERVFAKENLYGKVRKAAIISAVISCMFFILIGIFPSYENNVFFLYAHGFSTLFCFLSGVGYILLFSFLFYKSLQFPNTLVYIGLFQTGLMVLFLLTWNPVTEWMMTFGIIIWILSLSFYMIYKKR